MSEHGLTITQGRAAGKTIEGVFFADSKQQLEGFWNIQDLKDLKHIEQIVLSGQAAEYIKNKKQETDRDGFERSAVFGFKGGTVTVRDEQIGQISIQDIINRGIDRAPAVVTGNVFKESWKRLFGKPNPIAFHTHPHLLLEEVHKTIILKSPSRKEFLVPTDHYVEYVNFLLAEYSGGDLAGFFKANRYHNSLLLSTSNRLMYLVPSELFIPAGLAKFNRSDVDYQEEIDVLNTAAMFTLLGINSDQWFNPQRNGGILNNVINAQQKVKDIVAKNISLEELKIMADQALVRVAGTEGYLTFTSDNSSSNILKRLDISSDTSR